MPIRVLIVEDSLTVRRYLAEVISSDPAFEIVGEAIDGKRCIELCESLRPDVVTLDIMLPIMTGLAATEYIMAFCPTPILIVSSSMNRGEVFRTYDALAAGAVDVLDKPTSEESQEDWARRFLSTLKIVARIKVITHIRGRMNGVTGGEVNFEAIESKTELSSSKAFRCIAIGASTGGPGAVMKILSNLPRDFGLPIIIAIHISQPFATPMAEWLDGLSRLRVATATNGMLLPTCGESKVLLAPGDQHLIVRGGRLWLTNDPERHSCRPSVDTLFESVAREYGPSAIACLLTGMGIDGAEGLLAIKKSGGVTIAQDEKTSVVFGMPREAIARHAASHILSIGQIAPMLQRLSVRNRARSGD